MSESARRLKANKKLEAAPCGWCDVALILGEDAVLCEACERAHHAGCWDDEGGCSRDGCLNAPLAQLSPPALATPAPAPAAVTPSDAAALPPGHVRCPACRNPVRSTADLCDYCDHILSPDGVYRGPKLNAPGATSSLVWGIVGLLICGVILGAIAISESQKAKNAIAVNPRYGGEGMATAGFVLGIIGIVLHALVIIVRVTTL